MAAALSCNQQGFAPESRGPASDTVAAQSGDKVIILIIDGPRNSEAFDDPSHQHVPRMWNELGPQGTIVESFLNAGWTRTIPGHASVLTGTWQMLANDGSERPDAPTLFEYYRQQTGAPATDAYMIGGKAKLAACSYSTDPSYGAPYGATEQVNFPNDETTYQELITTLQSDRPRLVMASFSQVDTKAHTGVWNDYIERLENVDGLVADLWAWLQSDSFYMDRTYLFVTADHGRHDDQNGGFQNHGDNCTGCRRLVFLALGPDVRAGHIVDSIYTYNQRDVCATVAQLLGITAPQSDGNVMDEIFEAVTVGIR